MNIDRIFEDGESYEVKALDADTLSNIVAVSESELAYIDMLSIDGGEVKSMSMADYMNKLKSENI